MPGMDEIFNGVDGETESVEVMLFQDVYVFRKHEAGDPQLYREAALEKGEVIIVGGVGQIVRLLWDHNWHEFTPWLDNPGEIDGDETTIRYIRTEDLPQDF